MNVTGGASGLNRTSTTVTSTKESHTTTLSVCDGLAWKNFRANFEIVNQLNKWEDERALLKLRAAMREDAHRAIEHLVFPDNISIKDALDVVEKVFINPSSLDLAEAKFEAASREPGETLQAWHIRVRELYMRAFPHEKDVEKSKRLKDKFILNCRDQRLTLWVRDKDGYRNFTYTDVLTKAQDHEGNVQATALAYEGKRGRQIQELSLETESKESMPSEDLPSTQEYLGNLTDKNIHQMSALLHKTTPFALRKPGVGSAKPGACFHCGETGHLIRNCTTFQNAVQRIRRNPEQYGFVLAMTQGSNSNWNPSSTRPRGRLLAFLKTESPVDRTNCHQNFLNTFRTMQSTYYANYMMHVLTQDTHLDHGGKAESSSSRKAASQTIASQKLSDQSALHHFYSKH